MMTLPMLPQNDHHPHFPLLSQYHQLLLFGYYLDDRSCCYANHQNEHQRYHTYVYQISNWKTNLFRQNDFRYYSFCFRKLRNGFLALRHYHIGDKKNTLEYRFQIVRVKYFPLVSRQISHRGYSRHADSNHAYRNRICVQFVVHYTNFYNRSFANYEHRNRSHKMGGNRSNNSLCGDISHIL